METFRPVPEDYKGKVLLPEIKVPDVINDNKRCFELMSKGGTVFEIGLKQLIAKENYAFRLEVTPNCLLGFSGSRRRESSLLQYFDIPISRYSTDLRIYSPRTCYTDFQKFLSSVVEDESYRYAARAIRTCVNNEQLNLLTLEKHRIVVICPHEAEIERHGITGCVWAGDSFKIPGEKPQNAAEWASGAKTYWTDDIEFLSRTIWDYLKHYAFTDPKTKEAVTASLSAYHPNCSKVIDFLAAEKALIQEGYAYKIANVEENELERIFTRAATEIKEFRWMGYEIPYTIHYEYSTPLEKKKLGWLRFKSNMSFWIAIVSLIIGVLSILIGILSILL